MTASTTLTKKTKGADLYPPREIVENTKARRAWVAAKIAELSADPTIEAKSVGIGSYQHVSVWNVSTSAGRIQLRGICQGCASSIAIVDGAVAKHGYKRPGCGWQTASCIGAGHKPANETTTLTRDIIDVLRSEAVKLDAIAVERWAAYNAAVALVAPADRYVRGEGYDARLAIQKTARAAEGKSASDRQFATHLEANALPALGRALVEVVVA